MSAGYVGGEGLVTCLRDDTGDAVTAVVPIPPGAFFSIGIPDSSGAPGCTHDTRSKRAPGDRAGVRAAAAVRGAERRGRGPSAAVSASHHESPDKHRPICLHRPNSPVAFSSAPTRVAAQVAPLYLSGGGGSIALQHEAVWQHNVKPQRLSAPCCRNPAWARRSTSPHLTAPASIPTVLSHSAGPWVFRNHVNEPCVAENLKARSASAAPRPGWSNSSQ